MAQRRLILITAAVAMVVAACNRSEPSAARSPGAAGTGGAASGDGQRTIAPSVEPPTAEPPSTESLRTDLAELFALIESDRTGPARVRLRKIVDRAPDDGHAAFLFGLSYHVEKRYAKAAPWFEQAEAAAPGLAPASYFRGWSLYYLGDLPGARAAFERHLALAPDEHDAHFALGLIDLDEGAPDAAERRFDRVLELLSGLKPAPPEDELRRERSRALTRRSAARQEQGDLNGARTDLEEACALFPDHYEAHYRLFRIATRQGDLERAEAAQRAFLAAQRRMGVTPPDLDAPGTSSPGEDPP